MPARRPFTPFFKQQQYPNLDGLGLPSTLVLAVRRIYELVYQIPDTTAISGQIVEGTHAQRASHDPTAYKGHVYYETDTTLAYLSDGVSWLYQSGYYQRTQAQLATYAATLGTPDAGTRVWVTDYNHVLRWSGSAWARAPEDPEHSDTFHMAGAAPSEAGWHACDGSTVSFLKYDGTLGSRVLPNTDASPDYPRLGNTYSAVITAATAPTLAMNSYTPAGTITMNSYTPAGTIAMNSYTPAGSNSAPAFTGSALATHVHDAPVGDDGAGTIWTLAMATGASYTGSSKTVLGTADATSRAARQTSAVSAGTPAGTVAAPTFTGTPATLTGSFTGTPATLTGSFAGTPATLTGTITLPADPIAHHAVIHVYRQ